MHAICIAAYGSPLLMNLWKESKRKKQHETSSKVAEFYDTFDGCLLYGAFMDGIWLAASQSLIDFMFQYLLHLMSPKTMEISLRRINESHFCLTVTHTVQSNALLFFDHL